MKRVPLITIILVAGCFYAASCAKKTETQIQEEEAVYDMISEAAGLTESEPEEKESVPAVTITVPETEEAYVSPVDFAELKSQNEDVVGWIKVPGTVINYPVCFDGTRNYLEWDLYKQKSHSGMIFVDEKASDPMRDSVNVIYGHHMKNGTMFAAVDDFNDPDYFAEHGEVDIYLPEEELHLAPMVSVTGPADAEIRNISDPDSFNNFLKGKKINAGEMAEEYGTLYVLVTCNYSGDDFRTYLICQEV